VITLAFLLLTLTKNVLLQPGNLDPFIYTSYIQNYADLIHRYCLTYYSTRIAHLYPAGLIVSVFGSVPGYYIYHWLLICAAFGAVWSLARKHYSTPVAVFVTTLAAFHPWLLRSLFWDYSDSSGVVYLLTSTALLGTATPTDRLRTFLAGGACALASNCNIFLLASGGGLFVSYFIAHFRRSLKDLTLLAIFLVSGFFTFYLSLCSIRYLRFPSLGFFLDQVTVFYAGQLVGGRGERWHWNVVQLVENGWVHLLVPPVVLLMATVIIVLRRRQLSSVMLHGTLNLLLVIVVYAVIDFIYKVGVISSFYYFIYLFPATVFCIIGLLGEVSNEGKAGKRNIILYGGGILCLTAYICYPRLIPLISRMNFHWATILGCLALVGITLTTRNPKTALTLLVLTASSSPLLFYTNPTETYAAIHTRNSGVEWDVYRASIKLQTVVARYPPSKGAAGFWYTTRRDSLLNSVQSMYLWRYSQLKPAGQSK
jgi:hypothetical protein